LLSFVFLKENGYWHGDRGHRILLKITSRVNMSNLGVFNTGQILFETGT